MAITRNGAKTSLSSGRLPFTQEEARTKKKAWSSSHWTNGELEREPGVRVAAVDSRFASTPAVTSALDRG